MSDLGPSLKPRRESTLIKLAELKGERLKLWFGTIGSIIALATAMFAALKPEEEETANKAYIELSTKMEDMSKSHASLHKDVASIQGYLKAQDKISKLEIELAKSEAREARASMSRVMIPPPKMPAPSLSVQAPAIPEMQSSKPKTYKAKSIESL